MSRLSDPCTFQSIPPQQLLLNVAEKFTIIYFWPLFYVINPGVMRYVIGVALYFIWLQPSCTLFFDLTVDLFLSELYGCIKFISSKCSSNKLRLTASLLQSSEGEKILERRHSPAEGVVILQNAFCLSRHLKRIFRQLHQSWSGAN